MCNETWDGDDSADLFDCKDTQRILGAKFEDTSGKMQWMSDGAIVDANLYPTAVGQTAHFQMPYANSPLTSKIIYPCFAYYVLP